MYWAGGCPARVQRGGRRYPGETRWMMPSPVKVKRPINWRYVWQTTGDIAAAIIAFALLLVLLNGLALVLR